MWWWKKKKKNRKLKPVHQPNADVPSWQVTYYGELKINPVDYMIIDMFDYPAHAVQAIKDVGAKPIAYLSAHYETWRPDAMKFGRTLKKIGNWPGEYYIDWDDRNNQNVMRKRLQLAKDKGFWGVDLDNVDGPGGRYYFPWLLKEAKSLGLAVGLKNFVEILDDVDVDFYVSEASMLYELTVYRKFNKPTVRMYYNRGADTPDFIYEVRNKQKGNRF